MKPTVLRDVAILVIDDESGMRNFLQRALQKEYGLVETAADIDEAEQLRQRCHFDLIIADNRLPHTTGAEWLQQMRKQDQDTDVILITGYGDMDVAISALRGGASDFILKPFHADEIKQAIERCLARRTQNRDAFVTRRIRSSHQSTDGYPVYRRDPRDQTIGRGRPAYRPDPVHGPDPGRDGYRQGVDRPVYP